MSIAFAVSAGDGSITGLGGGGSGISTRKHTSKSAASSLPSCAQSTPLRGALALSLKPAGATNTNAASALPVGDPAAAADSKGDDISDKDSADHKFRRLQDLSLNERADTYSEQATGPVQPGYCFYKMLGLGPPLQVPIPDSVLVDQHDIRRVRNDRRGFLVCEKLVLHKQVTRDAFMLSCIESFVAESVPFGQQPRMADLRGRFVAVRKRPCNHPAALVANTCELLTPLAFQAAVLEYMDTLQGSCMLQKFVKGRGLKASVVRVFWHATACGAGPSGTVSGWYLTQKNKKFACYQGKEEEVPDTSRPRSAGKQRPKERRAQAAAETAALAGVDAGALPQEEEEQGKEEEEEEDRSVAWKRRHAAKLARVLSSAQIAETLSCAAERNKAFLEDMRAHPEIPATEQLLAKAAGALAHKAVGAHNIVSISGDRGVGVTPEALRDVSCMRVGRNALVLPHLYVERLVSWVQNVIQLTADVLVHLSDAVCDFVRDEQGNWWLLQLKGFRVSPLSQQRCRAWYDERAHGLVRVERATPAERRAKLDAERGYKCKLCGLNFQEGQTVEVEDAAARPGSQDGARALNTIPAYGYDLSRRMACRISEIYRDAKFPLTKFSRAVLMGEARVMEARSVAEKLRELEELELKRSTGGELSCCYLCFQNMEEYQRVQDRCHEIHELVRADMAGQRAAPKKKAAEGLGDRGQGKGGDQGPTRRRPRSASPAPRSPGCSAAHQKAGGTAVRVSASATFADEPKLRDRREAPGASQAAAARALVASINSLYRRNIDGSYTSNLSGAVKRAPRPNLDMPSVKRELSLRWTDIPRRAAQWRVLVAAHYISGATLPPSHPLCGSVGCLSYSLGQAVSVLPFINCQRGGESSRNPLILVKQMRVHYLFGTLQDVKDYFAQKALEVEVSFQPPDDQVGGAVRLPRLESRFSLRLGKLGLTSSGLAEGSVKADYEVPLVFQSMEPALLHLSVAVVKDEALPPQTAEAGSLWREAAVFWPPPAYRDSAPLPESWLGILSLIQTRRGSLRTADGAAAEQEAPGLEAQAEQGASSAAASIATEPPGPAAWPKTEDEILKDEGLPAARALIRDTFAALVRAQMEALAQAKQRQADAADAAPEDEFSALLNGAGGARLIASTKAARRARGEGASDEGEEEEAGSEEEDNFGELQAPKPSQIVGRQGHAREGEEEDRCASSSSSDEYDFDDELPTYDVIKAVFLALRRAEEAPAGEVAVDARGADGRLSEGFVLMRLAVEQVLQADSLPEVVTTANFSYILEECLSWARTQRTVLRSAAREEEQAASKVHVGTMSKTRYLPGMDSPPPASLALAKEADADAQHHELGAEWVISTEKLIYRYRELYPHSDLDVSYSQGELTNKGRVARVNKDSAHAKYNAAARRASTAAPPDEKTAKFEMGAPSSEQRKLRRFVLALSLFDLAGGGAESIDVASLRAHLLMQRGRVRKALSLANEGAINWPLLKQDFHLHLSLAFLPERAILAMHLLRYSDSLQRLFNTYDDQGTASISRTGFLVASEECFRGVTQRRQQLVADEVTEELEAFCTDKSMRAQANNTSLRRSTFHLGSADFSSLGSRRRQSSLGIAGKASHEPPTLWMRCDEHGIEQAFAADFMCVKCEEEHHGYLSGDGYVQTRTVTEMSQSSEELGRRSSTRRKSSFAFH